MRRNEDGEPGIKDLSEQQQDSVIRIPNTPQQRKELEKMVGQNLKQIWQLTRPGSDRSDLLNFEFRINFCKSIIFEMLGKSGSVTLGEFMKKVVEEARARNEEELAEDVFNFVKSQFK